MPTSPSSRPVSLLLTMGDPTGIGPEVLLKALSSPVPASVTVIGDTRWLRILARRLGISISWKRFRWIDVGNLPSRFKRGTVQSFAGRAAFDYLKTAVRLLKENPTQALVTAPVSKEAIVRAGIPWVGHTEYLGSSFECKPLMMFVTGSFRVSLVTTHLSIAKVPASLTREKVAQALKVTREALIRHFGISRPRMGLAALNPHAGEGGLFGAEEKNILLPAIRASTGSARTGRMRSAHPELVEGPVPVDSLIRSAAEGKYDAIICLYHDQALIPVKLLGWSRAVNLTLGLPFIRTSPVHGTAFDLVGRHLADPSSMRAAIHLAIHLARPHAR